MTSLLGEICHIFCCPPRPSHIVAKFAFLPPPPSYTIVQTANESNRQIIFKPEAGHFSEDAKSKMEVFYTLTKRNSRIACLHIRYDPPTHGRHSQHHHDSSFNKTKPDNTTESPLFTVLFSHGNAVDIGQMAAFLQSLSQCFRVNILVYDYSGYGASSGQTLEDNLYADAEAALNELRSRYVCPLNRIVLYGQSIGTAPTVELATRHKVAGVILHSGLLSGLRVVCPGTTRRFCFDPFTNIDKVSKIHSPTLIMHGTEDEVVGIHHGKELHARLMHPLEPLWIDGAGHNDIELFPEYTSRLEKFFTEDLILADSSVSSPDLTSFSGDRARKSSKSKDRSKLSSNMHIIKSNEGGFVPCSTFSSKESITLLHPRAVLLNKADEIETVSISEHLCCNKLESINDRSSSLHLSLMKEPSNSSRATDSSQNKKWSSVSLPINTPEPTAPRSLSGKKKHWQTFRRMSPVTADESLI